MTTESVWSLDAVARSDWGLPAVVEGSAGETMESTVRDVMTREFVAIPCNTSLDEAERILIDQQLAELFVVDEEGFVIGIVPDYAFLKRHLTEADRSSQLAAVMSRRFLVIGPDSPLNVAARYLREHMHHRLVVVENRRLIGVVTRTSVLGRLVNLVPPSDAAA